jgi:hypothetical protein
MLIKKVRFGNFTQCAIAMLTNDPPGCRCPQAPRAQPQGPGLQVPPDSHRVPYPPPVPLLQDRRCSPSHLEIRELHRLHHGLIDHSPEWMFKELGPDILHYDQGYCSKSSDSLDLSELKPARTTRLTCPLLLNCANKCDRIDTICSAIDRIRLAKSFPVAPISLTAGYHHHLQTPN